MTNWNATRPKLRAPVDVFKSCPECGTANLLPTDEQVYCLHCDWNSLTQYLEAEDAIFRQASKASFANRSKLKSHSRANRRAAAVI